MFWCDHPRDVVRVQGPDAAGYLQSQLSQDIGDLAVGGSRWSFLLEPTGRIAVLVRVWRTEDDAFVLDTDGGFGETLVARLQRFKIRVKADISTLDWRCIAVRGVSGNGVVAWGVGYDLLGESPQPPAGLPEGDAAALAESRIVAAWPAMGSEIVPGETIPGETGITGVAVSFTKGCYPGQELVERMDSRAALPPRQLRHLTVAEASKLGATVTSRSRDEVLAYVPRKALQD
jgi:folate-binding protein YgfZ